MAQTPLFFSMAKKYSENCSSTNKLTGLDKQEVKLYWVVFNFLKRLYVWNLIVRECDDNFMKERVARFAPGIVPVWLADDLEEVTVQADAEILYESIKW